MFMLVFVKKCLERIWTYTSSMNYFSKSFDTFLLSLFKKTDAF